MKSDRFPNLQFFRVKQIVMPDGVLPISASSWWEGVKEGRFPKPVRSSLLGSGITAWRRLDIETLIESINEEDNLNG